MLQDKELRFALCAMRYAAILQHSSTPIFMKSPAKGGRED
jgi:hypothetical protein